MVGEEGKEGDVNEMSSLISTTSSSSSPSMRRRLAFRCCLRKLLPPFEVLAALLFPGELLAVRLVAGRYVMSRRSMIKRPALLDSRPMMVPYTEWRVPAAGILNLAHRLLALLTWTFMEKGRFPPSWNVLACVTIKGYTTTTHHVSVTRNPEVYGAPFSRKRLNRSNNI